MATSYSLRTVGARLARRLRRASGSTARQEELQSCIERVMYFRGRIHVAGWAFHPGARVLGMRWSLPDRGDVDVASWGLPSPDVAAIHGPSAAACRFEFEIEEPDPTQCGHVALIFELDDHRRCSLSDLVGRQLGDDPFHQLYRRFFKLLEEKGRGSVLEIGSRARSGHVRSDLVPDAMSYVGFDIVEGGNVDVVGDAHALSHHFDPESFDAVFSLSTFEHLAMPWKVVLEMNAVLRPGGLVLVTSHQTFPLHETPWDYWRFSDWSWPVLFNDATGFEVMERAMGEPAAVVAHLNHLVTRDLDRYPSFLACAVMCRKTGPTSLRWDIEPGPIQDANYPR